MSTLKTPFRYDFVGSFLRPEKLKAAKKAFEEGTITKEELDRITDECVTEIVAKQKAAGFHAITDGEFRRKFWHLDFMWGFEGVVHKRMCFCFYLSYEISCFKICHLSVKLYTAAIFLVDNAFKSPHKIQMPEFSA